jgi:hypothetical protein
VTGQDNVFALYLDLNTGWVAAYPKANRGLAGETLAQYCQEFGTPNSILHDNAQEYLHGDFANLCREKQIDHTTHERPTHTKPKPDRTLYGHYRGENTLSLIHLRPRSTHILGTRPTPSNMPTEPNGLTRSTDTLPKRVREET